MECSIVHQAAFQGQVAKVRGRVTCWQFNDCVDVLRCSCPAYHNNAGRSCWNVQGTLCESSGRKHSQPLADKCHRCDFFIQIHAQLI